MHDLRPDRDIDLPPPELVAAVEGPVTDLARISTKSKSTVWLLTAGGSRYVAKRAAAGGLACERDVYGMVLPRLGLDGPSVRGWVGDDSAVAWLLVDHVPGRRPDLDAPVDVALVSAWVARLHFLSRRRSFELQGGGPCRPPAADRLAGLRASIEEAPDGRGPNRDERRRALDLCDELHGALPLLDRIAMDIPASFVHGDLLADWNLILTDVGTVVGVDWDHASWGSPAIDLAVVDPEAYCDALANLGDLPDREAIRRTRAVGVIRASLAHDLGRKPWKSQRKYLGRMLGCLRLLEADEGVRNGQAAQG